MSINRTLALVVIGALLIMTALTVQTAFAVQAASPTSAPVPRHADRLLEQQHSRGTSGEQTRSEFCRIFSARIDQIWCWGVW